MAPGIVEQLGQTIQRLKSEGVSILLAEQNLNFARTVCDHAYIIYQGSVCHESAIDSLPKEEYEKYCALQVHGAWGIAHGAQYSQSAIKKGAND